MKIRKIVFWAHLSLGLAAGSVLFLMAATGMILSFQPVATQWATRHIAAVAVPAGAEPMDLDALLACLREQEGKAPTQLTVRNDPAAAVVAGYGRERSLFVDPYSGGVRGENPARLAAFFATVEHLHRWLALDGPRREAGKAVTGAACLIFFLLILGGLWLWLPNRRVRPEFPSSGKARDWNWHNVAGFWASPFLLLLTLTGLVMAYPWANALLFRLAGSPPPPEKRQGMGGHGGDGEEAAYHAQAWFDAARAKVPDWRAITLRLPAADAPRVVVAIQERSAAAPNFLSQLTLDAETAEVQEWEPYSGQSLGRRLRGWVRLLHVKDGFGLPGTLVNAATAGAVLLLVWTGFALSWRRFTKR